MPPSASSFTYFIISNIPGLFRNGHTTLFSHIQSKRDELHFLMLNTADNCILAEIRKIHVSVQIL